MKKQYIYKKKDGKKIYSDVPLKDKELTLVSEIRGGLNLKNIIKK